MHVLVGNLPAALKVKGTVFFYEKTNYGGKQMHVLMHTHIMLQ